MYSSTCKLTPSLHILNSTYSSLLTTFIPLSYAPQLRFLCSPFSAGVSPYYLLSTCMLSTTLLTEAICFLAFLYPNSETPAVSSILSGKLRGARAVGAVSGVLHLALIWLCSCIS